MTDNHKYPQGPDPITNPFKFIQFNKRINETPLEYFDELFREYGDVAYTNIMGTPVYFIKNPDLIHEVLVTKAKYFRKDSGYYSEEKGLARFMGKSVLSSDGDYWRKQRKLIAPLFHTQRIKAYADTMVHFAYEQMAQWKDDTVIDVADHMTEATLMIVSKTLFDTDVREQAKRFGDATEIANDFVGNTSLLPTWIPTGRELDARQAIKTLDEMIYPLIEQRRNSDEDAGDLLTMLMRTEDEDGNRMTDEQVRNEALTIFMAGHETTANTLNWTLMQLAEQPEIAEKVRAELDEVLAGRAPTLEDLRALTYTKQVIQESMRLYPAVWGVGREATKDTEIGGYFVPKGTNVHLNLYELQRDVRWWDNATTFDPERFAEGKTPIKGTYIPFGNGARICVGNSFAMMEAQLLLASFMQKWTFDLIPNKEIVPLPRVTLYPRDGLPMRIKQREPMAMPV